MKVREQMTILLVLISLLFLFVYGLEGRGASQPPVAIPPDRAHPKLETVPLRSAPL